MPVGPLPTTEQWLFRLEGSKVGLSKAKRGRGRGESKLLKAEFGSRCIFNRIRTHESPAENSLLAPFNSQPEGRPSSLSNGRKAGREGSETAWGPTWGAEAGGEILEVLFSPTLSREPLSVTLGSRNAPSLSIMPTMPCSCPAWPRLVHLPPRQSLGGTCLPFPFRVGERAQPGLKGLFGCVLDAAVLSLGVWGDRWWERVRVRWNIFLLLNAALLCWPDDLTQGLKDGPVPACPARWPVMPGVSQVLPSFRLFVNLVSDCKQGLSLPWLLVCLLLYRSHRLLEPFLRWLFGATEMRSKSQNCYQYFIRDIRQIRP